MKIVDNVRMCDDCGERQATITSLSMNQMVFGGFPVQYRNRCQPCETKAAKKIDKMLKAVIAQNGESDASVKHIYRLKTY